MELLIKILLISIIIPILIFTTLMVVGLIKTAIAKRKMKKAVEDILNELNKQIEEIKENN